MTTLRPVRADDVDWLARMYCDRDAVGRHNWGGPLDVQVVRAGLAQQLAGDDTLRVERGRLVVQVDAEPVGFVSWRATQWGPTPASACPSIGIALLPAHRGRGVGTAAQRLLARLLFDALPIARVQADTATDNPAERKALERAGFTCEALLRGAEVRDGRVRDRLLFSMTRADLAAG